MLFVTRCAIQLLLLGQQRLEKNDCQPAYLYSAAEPKGKGIPGSDGLMLLWLSTPASKILAPESKGSKPAVGS